MVGLGLLHQKQIRFVFEQLFSDLISHAVGFCSKSRPKVTHVDVLNWLLVLRMIKDFRYFFGLFVQILLFDFLPRGLEVVRRVRFVAPEVLRLGFEQLFPFKGIDSVLVEEGKKLVVTCA